jgi:hypothetical protein
LSSFADYSTSYFTYVFIYTRIAKQNDCWLAGYFPNFSIKAKKNQLITQGWGCMHENELQPWRFTE